MGKDTSLTYSLYGKDVSASKALKNVGDEANKAHSHFSNLKTTALGVFAGNLLTSGATALVGAVGSAVSAAAAYETLGKKTAAVLKSTGNAAHTSVAGIQELAGQLEQLSGVDEEQIINSQNVLATFTQVQNGVGKGNDIFNQATKAALNMSSALGTDLQGSTLQVGKALNDPLKGITALSRAGVSFTQQQKDQIKTMVKSGDTLGAQKLILKELNTEFGGAAKAAGEGFNGSMARLKDTVADAGRNIATKLLPSITNVADGLNDLLKGDFAGFRDKMKEIGDGIKNFAQDVVKKVSDAWPKVKEQFAKWGNAFFDWLPDAALKFGEKYADFESKVINKIVDLLPKVTEKFEGFVGAASDWIGDVLPIWITKLADLVLKLGNKVTDALPGILDKLGKWRDGFVDWIPKAVTKLLNNISKLGNKLSDWISAHGSEIVSDLVQWAVHFGAFILKSIPGLLKNAAKLIYALGKWILTDGVPLVLKTVLNLGKAIIEGVWNGIAAATEDFRGKIIKWFKENVIGGVKKLLGIASPSKVFKEIGGNVVDGFSEGLSGLKRKNIDDVFVAMVKNINDKLAKALDGAKQKLADAKQAFADFSTSVRDSINSGISFSEAISASMGSNGNMSFLDTLALQAGSAQRFAAKISKLVKLGLSESGIQQVLSAGAEAGGAIADQLIAGGSDAITKANGFLKATDAAAKQLGDQAAKKFYQAGINQGNALVQGYQDAIKQAKGVFETLGEDAIDAIIRKAGGKKNLSKSDKKAIKSIAEAADIKMPKLAKGGVVSKPTVALIGEAGPEAIVPLSRMRGGDSGGTVNVTIHVAGSVIQERDLAVSVRDNIAQMMRRRGLNPNILGV